MKKLLPVAAGAFLVTAGAAFIIIAEHQGWLPGGTRTGSPASCPHGLSGEDCPFCDPGLVERRGQCAEHGVPEALCTRCNPSLIAAFKANGDWCAEHGLPESQCMICHPELVRAGSVTTESLPEPTVKILSNPEMLRSRRPPAVACATETLRVQFASRDIAATAGLEYSRVERREITETVVTNAELAFDGNRFARLSSRAPGTVREIRADLGDRIEDGQILAVVDSVDLGRAKAEYLQAAALVKLWERNHARERDLSERHIGTESDLLDAETKLAESRVALSRSAGALRNLGLADSQIAGVIEKEDTSSLLPLTAPFSGTIVERSLALGEVVDPSRVLFAIADTSTMWAMLDVYEADMARLGYGQSVILEVESLRGDRYGGRITWISSQLDRRTRTLQARAEIANPAGALRAGMFGKAIVSVSEKEPALVVPKEAVQWEGCCNIVFLRRSDVLFEPRKVRLGYESERIFVVEDGVDEGDVVVTTGSFLLKTEILKNSIGAGCCEVSPGTD